MPGGVQGLDRYAYVNNNPLRYTDPSGHGVFDTVSQFLAGFSAEFLVRNNMPGNILMPDVAESLSVSSSESTSMLVGRVAADVVTIGLGVVEVTTGMGITGGGAVVSCGSSACLGVVATTATGVAITAYGVSTALSGASGLGSNLSRITNKDGNVDNPFNLDEWSTKKPFGGVVQNQNGTTTTYNVRNSPGNDGGWSRINIIKDANGNTIKVIHEAWNGKLDPRVDSPSHIDIKYEIGDGLEFK